jgi:hypothetical protein
VQLQSLNDRNRNEFHQRLAHPPGTPLTVPLIVYNTPQSVPAGEVIPSMAADAGFTLLADGLLRMQDVHPKQ